MKELKLLHNRSALLPSIDDPIQVPINAVSYQDFGMHALAFE